MNNISMNKLNEKMAGILNFILMATETLYSFITIMVSLQSS